MSPPRRQGGAAALDLSLLLALAVGLVYVAGWSYAYHWYGRFGLGLIPLAIQRENFLLYGFWTLRLYWWVLVLPVVALGLVGRMLERIRMALWLRRAAPVVLLLAFPLAYALGRATAQDDFRRHLGEGFAAYPLARVWLNSTTAADPAGTQVAQDLAAASYRLLLQSGSQLYLIHPDGSSAPPLLVLPVERVAGWRLVPRNPGLE
jgi:hypothetical protein